MRAYRARLPELLAALPHDLPLRAEDPPASGPKKPDLVRAFEPLGYDCHGKSGSFTLRRRTAGHLAVELALDVGTWGNAILAHMKVLGLVDGQGFKATLPLPVSAQRNARAVPDRRRRALGPHRRQSGGAGRRARPQLRPGDRGGRRPVAGMVPAGIRLKSPPAQALSRKGQADALGR